MKIKDLPLKLQELATKEQVRQGNKPDVNLNFDNTKESGNFSWLGSELGYDFWDAVFEGSLRRAKQIYDWESEGNNSEAEKEGDKRTWWYAGQMKEFEELWKESIKAVTEGMEDKSESEFQEIATQVARLLEYKNAKYGKSALNPIEIFNGKSKVGQRADDKVSRIKNNPVLQKNDVVDLIGYLILMCQENGWKTFDEFMD